MAARSARGTRTTRDVAEASPGAESGGKAKTLPTKSGVPAIVRADFARIVGVDDEKREVELCATSEAVDAHGTVFGYEASKDAFTRWAGNVREMHERKAVGRRVAVRFQDSERRILVRVRISQGAADTWAKILDGTLRGASIGASNVEWRSERRAGRDVPVAQRYDLVELSLVDLPSNPDALGIAVVRDGVPVPEQLDVLSDLPGERDEGEDPDSSKAGDLGVSQRVDGGAAGGNGGARALFESSELERATLDWPEILLAQSTLEAGRVALDGAAYGAEPAAPHTPSGSRAERLAALGAPGYVERAAESPAALPADAPGAGVPARTVEASRSATDGQTVDGSQVGAFHSAARAILAGCGCIACDAALAVLDGDGSADGQETRGEPGGRLAVAAMTRALAAHTQRLEEALAGLRGMHAGLTEVAGTLRQIERRVAVIEEQPLPGGPQLRAAEKTHALQPEAAAHAGEQLRALQSLAGRLSDPQAQIAVATEMIRLQQEAAGLSPAMQAMPRAGGRP